ncbi:unnamed protein product [Effrenium voratum]|uniref:EB domain-containing protein n=1 Tax=Effrenium voratum TaxID=2562239 RepID=A0AA36MSF6_9DINO|nr:unnamed protein product [Effrenium voratum]CAJ1422886.1 unnamed protein product [Effrenium voratum]
MRALALASVVHLAAAQAGVWEALEEECDQGLGLMQVKSGFQEVEAEESNSLWQGVRETGTTCMFSNCPDRLGSECHHWRCVCLKGFRYHPAGDGTCVSEGSGRARQFTNSTCFLASCPSKYGLTRCVGHECLCLEGYELQGGVCTKTAHSSDRSFGRGASSKSCKDHTRCAELDLKGDCCPNPVGAMLGCCA